MSLDLETKVVVALIHEGLAGKITQDVLAKIPDNILPLITQVQVNNSLRAWINCNSKGVVVKSYPSFLVTVNEETRVYNSLEVFEVVKFLSDLIEPI